MEGCQHHAVAFKMEEKDVEGVKSFGFSGAAGSKGPHITVPRLLF